MEDIEAKVGETVLEIVFPNYVKLAQPDFCLIQMRSHHSSLRGVIVDWLYLVLVGHSFLRDSMLFKTTPQEP